MGKSTEEKEYWRVKVLTASKQAFYRPVIVHLLTYASTAALKYIINLQYYFKTSKSYNKIGIWK